VTGRRGTGAPSTTTTSSTAGRLGRRWLVVRWNGPRAGRRSVVTAPDALAAVECVTARRPLEAEHHRSLVTVRAGDGSAYIVAEVSAGHAAALELEEATG
jgi:hypothetical protein